MFTGHLQRIHQYSYLQDNLRQKITLALEHIMHDPTTEEKVIEEGDLWYNIIEAQTVLTTERQFEIHKEYIDVHVLLDGQEYMGYAHDELVVNDLHMVDQDVYFGTSTEGRYLEMKPGEIVMFFPNEIHKPLCHLTGQAKKVRKAIIKIRQASLV